MKIQDLIKQEEARQESVINLIASENYPSQAVRNALSSVLVGKYAEGRPSARYYAGNAIIDEIENTTQALGLKVFGLSEDKWSINVQPYSGSIANLASYLGALDAGDSILAMSLAHGGHLTHGHSVSLTGKLFKFSHYGVNEQEILDYEAIKAQAFELKPRLIVCGATAYSRVIDFAKFREIANTCGALLVADISHIAGLIAGGQHPSPFPYADIVTSTTHKTLRGPRGAFIISRKDILLKDGKEMSDLINKAVFPGLQGGPQMHTISAMGIAFEEALMDEFKQYTKNIIDNAQALANRLREHGFRIISGGTENHMMLIDVASRGYDGTQAQDILEQHGIVANKNAIPFDSRKPNNPSGIRFGVQAETTRGADAIKMSNIADLIAKSLPDISVKPSS